MQPHTLDALHATFREREQRAISAAHRYRQAKQIREARTATEQPAPPTSTVRERRRLVMHVPRPIRMWLLGVLLLASACSGGTEDLADDPMQLRAVDRVADSLPGPPSGTQLLYQDCFNGEPPQIC